MDETRAYYLAELAARGTISETEKAELEQWRKASPDNEAAYLEVLEILEITGAMEAPVDPQTNSEWEKVQARVDNAGREIPLGRNTPVKKTNRTWAIFAVAASVAILAVVGKVFIFDHDPVIGAVKTFEASAHEMKEVKLQDGSVVTLNAGSKLVAEAGFGEKDRRLRLEGEAYFEVAKDPQKPFSITAGNTVTTVLGTKFNLRAFGDEGRIQVDVTEGKVSFESDDQDKGTMLTAGMAAVSDASGIRRIEKEGSDAAAWMNGKVVAVDEPLEILIPRLEKLYGLEIEAPAEVMQEAINGPFEKNKKKKMIKDLELMLECEAEVGENKIRFKMK